MKAATTQRMYSAVWLAEWLMRYENNQEAAFLAILEQIANGKSYSAFCQEENIGQGILLAWIRFDVERDRRFTQAILDRKFIDAEMGRDAVIETILANPKDLPTHNERLKAAGMLMGTDDDKKGGSGVTINIVRFADEPVEIPQGYVVDVNHTS